MKHSFENETVAYQLADSQILNELNVHDNIFINITKGNENIIMVSYTRSIN